REDTSLTITGTVRNPPGGPRLEGLTAVVSLIDSHGGLISTKDVPLDYRALGPGEEAPFKVTIPDPGSVARYRVSFRAGTDVVPTSIAAAIQNWRVHYEKNVEYHPRCGRSGCGGVDCRRRERRGPAPGRSEEG